MPNNPPRILLVDDEPYNLLLLEELLDLEGYKTLSAASGSEALEKAKEFAPDLILLDVMMPDMDGFEVCQHLREDANLQAVQVIFLTALDDDESRLRGLEMMGDDYLTKPIKSNLLLKKISSSLRLNQIRDKQSEKLVDIKVQEQTKVQLLAASQINQYLSEKFRLFVPQQFLNRIAPKGLESIALGNAKEEELTILFCDIRQFTAISEGQAASETFEWLNVFFTSMNQAIVANKGFIDKFLGDAIMAVFDRPGCHAKDAVTAAVMMKHSLNEFNLKRDRYNLKQPLDIGIGIHTGIAMIGTVGSDQRMDSTVIGDVVNTASRLEELTKVYNCKILVSDAVITHLGFDLKSIQTKDIAPVKLLDLFQIRWVDQIAPRGKQSLINLYEVLAS